MLDDRTQRFRKIRIDAKEFERLALGLLRAEALATDRQLLIGPEGGAELRYFDALFPTGFDDLPGPTAVEVKYRAQIHSFDMFFRNLERIQAEFGSILFVVNEKGKDFDRIKTFIQRRTSVPFRILGGTDVEALAKKHPAMALTFDMRFFDDAIGSFEERDIPRYTPQYITSLRSAFREDQLVLFLGAGVSLSADLPDWPTLLNRLTLDLLKSHPDIDAGLKDSDELLKYFQKEAPTSPLITARFLRDSIPKFPELVRRSLYEQFKEETPSELIQVIGKLCLPERARQGLLAVVNYNFDDLIERELTRRNVNHHIVIAEEDSPSRDELPIYHPHGFLPRKGAITPTHEASLVLSEDAYHSQFIDPYAWPNITQLNLLRNHVCLFLGLSMTDPNLRRLLEISQRKRAGIRHYAILMDHWGALGKTGSKGADLVSRVFRGLEETSFFRLGVSIIWVNDYSEIPKLVSQIRE
jgi:hypothetical protein